MHLFGEEDSSAEGDENSSQSPGNGAADSDPDATPIRDPEASCRQQTSGYQRPPQEIIDILDAPLFPAVALSPDRRFLLLIERSAYPPISDLAAPVVKLAGLRINPRTSGPHLPPRTTGFILQSADTGQRRRILLPPNADPAFAGWSPDGRQLAFTLTTADGIQLGIASVSMAEAVCVEQLAVNACCGNAVQWLPDSSGLLVRAVSHDRGRPPEQPTVPKGPIIEESSGQAGPVRTYQDLLRSEHDERLFEYYCTSQLTLVDRHGRKCQPLGSPALIAHADVSPDGQYILVVRNHRPFSYVLPASRFPKLIEIWSISGTCIRTIASLPLEDGIPIEGVPMGPRSAGWRPTSAATLVWLEALDHGDPRQEAEFRDRIVSQAAPFAEEPLEAARIPQRCAGITWGQTDGLTLVRDYDRDRRWMRTYRLNFDRPQDGLKLIWERSVHDRYTDPGTPMLRSLPNGRRVMWQHQQSIFLQGDGATPAGDRPFLDRFDLQDQSTVRLFACDDNCYESVSVLLSDDGTEFITQHESPSDPPNYFRRTISGARTALTQFPDPAPQLRRIHRELITYHRDDGVQLSCTLYLPPDHQPGTRLPTVVWAYPREYNDPETAGQISGSTNRFVMCRGISHLFLLTQGYAILDAATIPVVGAPEIANDTFVTQIVASAQAAIDKAVALGVADRGRVGIGGHSYGAFMTASLLAHSDLFQAGVARSGAYNRTLTPFGFQNERRTFWEAPEIYCRLSPFMAADRIRRPILLIHGDADNNSGTFPMQSERLYQAIRGNGGTVRFVTLPHESHGYVARESVEHTLWEMVTWFDRYLKPPDR